MDDIKAGLTALAGFSHTEEAPDMEGWLVARFRSYSPKRKLAIFRLTDFTECWLKTDTRPPIERNHLCAVKVKDNPMRVFGDKFYYEVTALKIAPEN